MISNVNCAVCKNKIIGDIYKLASSSICKECNDENFLTTLEVADMLGMHGSTLSKWNSQKKYEIVPPHDAVRCLANYIWKRSTIVEFKKNLPVFSLTQVEILTELGLLRYQIAKELNVNVFHLNVFCSKNGIQSNFVNRTTDRQNSINKATKSYNRCSVLLNKCVSNALT